MGCKLVLFTNGKSHYYYYYYYY